MRIHAHTHVYMHDVLIYTKVNKCTNICAACRRYFAHMLILSKYTAHHTHVYGRSVCMHM